MTNCWSSRSKRKSDYLYFDTIPKHTHERNYVKNLFKIKYDFNGGKKIHYSIFSENGNYYNFSENKSKRFEMETKYVGDRKNREKYNRNIFKTIDLTCGWCTLKFLPCKIPETRFLNFKNYIISFIENTGVV